MSSSTDRIDNFISGVAIKAPCRLATTANVNLYGLQTIDSVVGNSGDRICVWKNTNASENGIYVMTDGPWVRAQDFNGNRDVVKGTIFRINEGVNYTGAFLEITNNPTLIGSSDINFSLLNTVINQDYPSVDNVAAIRALDINQYNYARTNGRYLPGDGGFGQYWKDPVSIEPDDGFKVIAPNSGSGGRWKLMPDESGWYNVLQGGARRDGTPTASRLQVIYNSLSAGDKLYHPSPAFGQFYNLEFPVEVKDLDGVEIDFGVQKDIAIGGRVLNFKYTGSTLTDKYDAVIKLLGLVGSQVYGACVNVDGKARCGIWFSGTNLYDGSVTTSNRRSSNCQFHDCYAIGINATGTDNCAIIIGEDEGGNASQTDLLTIWNLKGAGGETGAAVDTTPVTYGMQILGLNAYVTNKGECELTGDCGLYVSGNVSGERFYCLNNSVAGIIVGSANASVVLNAPYMEGLVGRPVQTYVGSPSAGESVGSKPIHLTGMVVFPGGAGPTYEAYFTSNQPVFMSGCFLKGWKTDNYASSYERPYYVMLGNKYFDPITDYTNRNDIALIELSQESGGTGNTLTTIFNNPKMTYRSITAAPDTTNPGSSFHNVLVVNSGAANTLTLPPARLGMSVIRAWRTGAGALIVKAAVSESIIRHDTAVAATTDCRLVGAGEYGFIEFNCIENGKWWPSSMHTITYS